MLLKRRSGQRANRPRYQLFSKMPRTPRHLFSGLVWVLAAFVCLVTAGASFAQTKGAPLQKPTASEVVLPSAETTVILIRTTLLSLSDALRTGNFTVLRDIAAPSFRDANSAGRLYEIFSNLAGKNLDLSVIALLVPQVPHAPSVDQNKRLHISGYFPGNPIQLNFDLIFEAVNNQWRLFGIAVNPTPSTTANPEAPASPKTPPPPKGKTDGRRRSRGGHVQCRTSRGCPRQTQSRLG